MANIWEQWEGRTVDGKYRLNHYLGGSGELAVFRTLVGDQPVNAVIKIIPVEASDANEHWLCWQRASDLSHPNLLRILAVGRTVMDARESHYVVEEFAEENLGQIVPERALTPDEARGMLGAVLAPLEYVHSKGLVHGSICPAHILGIGDQVKLSSDGLQRKGAIPRSPSPYDAPEVAAHGISEASDVWALGITLAEVMTQHAPALDATRMSAPDVGKDIPEPFHGIISNCLQIDPRKRCDLREIHARLEPESVHEEVESDETAAASPALASAIPEAPRRATWPRWIIPVVAVAAMIILIVRQHSPKNDGKGSSSTVVQQAPADTRAAQSEPSPPPKPASPQSHGETKPATAKGGHGETAPKNEIVQQGMPEVIPSARRTIEGKIRVRINVDVGPEGDVTKAAFASAGPSKYFARVALEAAKRWKFVSAENTSVERKWTLQFTFTRERTSATATRRD